MPQDSAPRPKNPIKWFFSNLGPGLISGAADADEQILERLLALNQRRAADEKPATKKQPRASRAKTDEEFV